MKPKVNKNDYDFEGKVKCILWTDRVIAISDRLLEADLPRKDVELIRLILQYAYPEEQALSTSAIGFVGEKDLDNDDE